LFFVFYLFSRTDGICSVYRFNINGVSELD
jgi:hypothetical protein